VSHPSDVLLSDGSTVHVRQINTDDADRIVALHARFSDRTRYLRYFSPYPRIPARDLARFVTVDHRDREALVMATGEDLIAVGRYERLGPAATDAEVAFVVEDAFQGRGIGSLLLEHLAEAARAAGITRFVAEVLPENRAMLNVFHDAGYHVSREWADGVVHLTFPIAATSKSVEAQRAREHHPEAASIARLLAPRSVAVYGVRHDGTGAGAQLLRHVAAGGFAGPVYPIHPSASTLEGLPAYPSAGQVPGPVDLALVAVPAARVPDVVADAGAAGAHALVVVSAGFAESSAARSFAAGAEALAGPAEADDSGAQAQQDLLAKVRVHGLRLVGPNCLGIVNSDPAVRLNATYAPVMPVPGRVGVFCQSAAMGIALLSEAHDRSLGLSTFASVGNRADVSGNDLLQFWRDDPHTDVVLLYLETFGNPHKFARIARELGRDKPIVAVAAGAAAGLGSGSDRVAWPRGRAPDDQAVAALFAHSGVIRVETVAELLDVGQILADQPLPAGDRVGVVGNNAALVQLADAACARANLGGASHARTVADPSRLAGAVRDTLADDTVDTVLVVIAPPLPGATIDDAVAAVASAVPGADKPVVTTVVGAPSGVHDPVPRFGTVEEAVRALARVAQYAAWRREPIGEQPILSDVDTAAANVVVQHEGPATDLLAAYGVTELPTRAADTERAVVQAARELGYPVAVKAAGPDLRHRLDLGAVRLDIADSKMLKSAYAEIAARFGPAVLVQPTAPPGVACVVEVVDDPAFGPVVGFGVGGIATELLGDRAWRAAPLTNVDAAALVRTPRAAEMLHGYRGATPADLVALEDLLLRIGQLADDNPAVKRLLLNPVLAHAEGLSVVHAEVAYGEPLARPDTGPRRLR
jgi:acyl-CoA synthetase (NDP forming)/GNAT superfamily N-acetyltransferase